MAGDPKDRLGRFARQKAPEPERAPEAEEAAEQGLGGELDFGLDTGPDHIARMQRQLGNQAVLDVVEEAPAEDVGALDLEADVERETKRRTDVTPRARTGLPPVHDGGGGADWDLLWGDDGEPEDAPPAPPPRRVPARRRYMPGPAGKDGGAAAASEAAAEPRDLDARDPERGAWRWIARPAEAAGPDPSPEDLVGLPRLHPLARCRAAGGFLSAAATSPAARALAELAGPLPGGPGLASLIARAAAMVESAQAIEAAELSGVEPPAARAGVARAVSLALEDDARDRVDALAPRVAREQRLAAHLLFDACSEGEVPDAPGPSRAPRPDLAEAAVRVVARPWPVHDPPRYADSGPAEVAADPAVAALDAILRAATGGGPPPVVDARSLAGMQQGAWTLLDQAGVIQRELASAGLAAWRVAGETARRRIRALLEAADRSLRALARSIYATGRRLGELEGAPLDRTQHILDAAGEALADGAHRVRRLRDAAFSALARIAAGSGQTELANRHAVPDPSRVALHTRQPRAPRPDEAPLLAACEALRGGDVSAAQSILSELAGATPAGLAAGVLLSGVLLARGEPAQALAASTQAAERAMEAEQWALFSAALLDTARGLELIEGPDSAREALRGALQRVHDPGVLLQARLLELGG